MIDLFGAPPRPATRPKTPAITAPAAARLPTLIDIRGDRPPAWEQLVCADGFKPAPRIIVARNWTGVVIEDLSHPRLGRKFLHSDGTIQDVARDTAHYLTVFMTADEARALHIRFPLVHAGAAGTDAARFRLAEPGEDAPLTIKLPEGM
jgi:hypothetical protein